MRVGYRVFWLQKAGCSPDEYEDAFSPSDPAAGHDTPLFRCAIADGATETSFSGLWARLLTDGYVNRIEPLFRLQQEWFKQVSGRELAWYAEEKLASGAFAAFLGLTISALDSRADGFYRWSAWALGDCCLFQVRDGQVLVSLPLTHWRQFNTSPVLISSRADRNDRLAESLVEGDGDCRSGDRFFLMTDALSRWFLHRLEQKNDAVALVDLLDDEEAFRRLVDEQRVLKDSDGVPVMPNDDVTLVKVQL